MRWKQFLARLACYRVQLRWCLVPTELSHPDIILLVCAYICFPLWSAPPSTYHYCAAPCKLFFYFYFSICKRGRPILVRKTPVAGLLNWKTRARKTTKIILMTITISRPDSCKNPFMWNELICSDDEERTLCGLVFPPQSPPNCCSSVWARADSDFYDFVRLSKGCNGFPG